ncbi:hypothetical protein [Natrinema halophilum]|uniref:Capsule polysaccharide biosynthesis protein n=1 Tax=Natrinema halophilum TaxID=1699371 RepID=A0A7D5GMY1_9EURY|nr:hypothetical protein [Natrinema halophilum]QLG48913.1 hypothetical protein HYG82_08645 [Natrinema halophilum]
MNVSSLSDLPRRAVDVVTLSKSAQAFAQANRQSWSRTDAGASTGELLTDVTLHHPGYVLSGTVAGKHLAEAKDLNLSFLFRRYDRDISHICQSYESANTYSIAGRLRSPSLVACALADSRRIYASVDSIADLVDVTYDGILIGDLIYNTYLKKHNVGTIESLSQSVLPVIFDTVLYERYYDRLLSNNEIRAVIGAQASYAKSGVLLRLALNEDLDVFERIFGPKRFTIRRFTDISETYNQANRPSDAAFERVWTEHREQGVERSRAYFDDRLSGDDDDVIVSKAYSNDKSIIDRETLVDELDLNPEKPIAVLMTHVFLDAAHFRGSLFRDYVTWVRETLQHVRTDSSTNWILKPHPGSDRFDCKHTVDGEFDQAVAGFDNHTVRIMPDDVSTTAVHEIADVVLTVRGSAGIEFPALGTPAIVASDCHYSGFGFAHEPDSKQAYFDLLDTIGDLPPLTERQVERANVMAYLLFVLMRVPSEYIPEISKTEVDDVDKIWQRAARLLSETSVDDSALRAKIEKFVEDDHQHLLDFDKIEL